MNFGDIYDLEADALRLARHASGFYEANGLRIHRSLLLSLIQNGMAGACVEAFDRPRVRRECLLALAAACLAKLRPYYGFRLRPLIGWALGRVGALPPGDAAAAASIEAYVKAAGATGAPHRGIALRLLRNLAADRNAGGAQADAGQMDPIADLLGAAADGWARLLVRRTTPRADRLPIPAIRSVHGVFRLPVSLVPPAPRTPDNPH